MGGVFISYRRQGSAGWTGRVYDRAVARLGRDEVFLDVEAIAPGEDFSDAIDEILDGVDTVLVVIGPTWLEAVDEGGRRRLDDPGDVVRREVAGALARGLRVIPVLVGGAGMPSEGELPAEIGLLARRNAVSVSDVGFDADVDRLLDAVAGKGERPRSAVGNLPSRRDSFVGREREVAELAGMVGSHRLVTLIGAGGSGKTTLAVELARSELAGFADGVWFVDLSAIEDQDDVARAVGTVLDLQEEPDLPVVTQVGRRLDGRSALVVLDNCEHVIDAAASFASELIDSTTLVRVVATSREPLDVAGERRYPVPTLGVPEETGDDPETIAASPAVRLFVDRAVAVNPGFRIGRDNAPSIAAICRRLDGLPLAIELAAGRLNVLTPADLEARLGDSLRLLAGSARDRPSRQQTLEATLDWSYGLLKGPEQRLLSQLAVFRGGFTLDAAETVCALDDASSGSVLDLLGDLSARSLVHDTSGRAGRRFRLLETIKVFAAGKLTGGADALAERHARYFRDLAVDSFDKAWGPDAVATFDRVEDEWPNIDKALAWHYANGQIRDGLLMAGSLYRFAARRHYVSRLLEWLRELIATDPPPGPQLARAALALGTVSPDFAERTEMLDHATTYYRESGTTEELHTVLNNAFVSTQMTGDWERNRALGDEIMTLPLVDPQAKALRLFNQAGLVYHHDEHPEQALALTTDALEYAQRSESPEQILYAWQLLTWYRTEVGDLEGAETALREAEKIDTKLGTTQEQPGLTKLMAARLALARSDHELATTHLTDHANLIQSLAIEDEWLNLELADSLLEWAALLAEQDHYQAAVVLLSAHARYHERASIVLQPGLARKANRVQAVALEHLDADAIERAQQLGAGMDLTRAIAHAQKTLAPLETHHKEQRNSPT